MFVQVLFNELVKEMKAQVEVFWLNGGNHALRVKERSEDSVMLEVNLEVLTWLSKQGA